jgi:hypothetical protein
LTLIRSFAVRTLDAVIRRAPPEIREWGTAMLREMDYIESDWEALAWALGGAKSVMTTRKGVKVCADRRLTALAAIA